jgi:hypothetical protein
MVLPKLGGQRRGSNVERRTEEPLSENRDKLAVLLGVDRNEEFGDCHRRDDDDLLVFVQVAEQDSRSPLHLRIMIAQRSLRRIDLAQASPDQYHRIECDTHLSPATSFK